MAGSRSGAAPASAAKSPEGRERELLARLEACLREPWPAKERDRLFWRVGEVRIEAAGPPAATRRRLGYAEASYSLVWALARCAGPMPPMPCFASPKRPAIR